MPTPSIGPISKPATGYSRVRLGKSETKIHKRLARRFYDPLCPVKERKNLYGIINLLKWKDYLKNKTENELMIPINTFLKQRYWYKRSKVQSDPMAVWPGDNTVNNIQTTPLLKTERQHTDPITMWPGNNAINAPANNPKRVKMDMYDPLRLWPGDHSLIVSNVILGLPEHLHQINRVPHRPLKNLDLYQPSNITMFNAEWMHTISKNYFHAAQSVLQKCGFQMRVLSKDKFEDRWVFSKVTDTATGQKQVVEFVGLKDMYFIFDCLVNGQQRPELTMNVTRRNYADQGVPISMASEHFTGALTPIEAWMYEQNWKKLIGWLSNVVSHADHTDLEGALAFGLKPIRLKR